MMLIGLEKNISRNLIFYSLPRLVLTAFFVFGFCPIVFGQSAPHPPSPVISGINFDWSTHDLQAPGSDNWPITWADDDHQYSAWGDGGGFGGTNSQGRVSLGMARVEGALQNYTGKNVWGGKSPENSAQFSGKSYGILSVDGILYMWVSPDPLPHLNETRIAWSTNHGATWTPTSWKFTFSDGLTIPTFLNFGKDYAGSRDSFVYSYYIKPQYGPGKASGGLVVNGFDVHKPGVVYLSRVPKGDILDQTKYEFFAGLNGNGDPTWSSTPAQKQPVFEDPNGVGWNLSVSYNEGLNRYLLSTEHTRTHKAHLGIFDAPEPWGPWTTVFYTNSFGNSSLAKKTFYWNFSNKWLSPDGKDFVMIFTGQKANDAWNLVEGSFEVSNSDTTPPDTPTGLTFTGE